MKRVKCVFLGSLALSASPVLAKNDTVTQGPEPDWAHPSELLPVPDNAEGLIFVRRNDVLVHLDAQGQENYQNQRYKLLHPQALQLGNVGISWNPAVGAPVVHALRVHRDGAVVDVLKTAEFEILRREGQLEQAALDGMLTAVLRVPDLRVGDELEMAFTTRAEDPTLGQDSSGILMLVGALQPGRYRLGLSWDKGQEPHTQLSADLADVAQRSAQSVEVQFDNPATLTPPKFAPPRYGWQRLVEYSDFPDWQTISRRFNGLFVEAAKLPSGSPIKAEADRIKAAHSNDLARAQAALELVQRQVRYIYVGINGGNFTPASADETWQRRYGDCKGKTALLLALLNEMGIAAKAVLVNNSAADDGMNQRLPSPGLFDHVLVQADIDGQTYWMDGTLPDIANARSEPASPYRWVLPLTATGNALTEVPWHTFDLPQEMGIFEIDARAGFKEPGRLTHTTVKRGLLGMVEYAQMSAMTPDQLTTTYRNALAGGQGWDTVESVRYRYDRDTQASLITIAGTGPVEWEDDGDGAYSLSLPGGGFSPPERRQRPADVVTDAPFYMEPDYSCYVTTVRLPEGTDVENWGFNTTFDTGIFGRLYYRMMERRDDGTIRMVRGSRVYQPEISPETAKRDNQRLADFDNSKANINYDPDKIMKPWGNLSKVPATYEFDWTSRGAPCLPADVSKGG